MKIVTGAEASQFKSMRFRNYCKFSCTSGSVYPYEGRVRPLGSGNEDGLLQIVFGNVLATFCVWSNFLWDQRQAIFSGKSRIFAKFLVKPREEVKNVFFLFFPNYSGGFGPNPDYSIPTTG